MSRLGLVAVVLIAAVGMQAEEQNTEPVERATLVGVYTSVTESECNVELQLFADGRAEITQSCRLEDGSHRDVHESTPASWTVTGTTLKVEYSNVQDVLEYDDNLSYEGFGAKGTGPGLKHVQPIRPESRLQGYGLLWKRPLQVKFPA